MRLSEMREGKEYTLLPFTRELRDIYRQEGPGLNEDMIDLAETSPKVKVECIVECVRGVRGGIVEIEGSQWSWMPESFVGVQEEVKLSIN